MLCLSQAVIDQRSKLHLPCDNDFFSGHTVHPQALVPMEGTRPSLGLRKVCLVASLSLDLHIILVQKLLNHILKEDSCTAKLRLASGSFFPLDYEVKHP